MSWARTEPLVLRLRAGHDTAVISCQHVQSERSPPADTTPSSWRSASLRLACSKL